MSVLTIDEWALLVLAATFAMLAFLEASGSGLSWSDRERLKRIERRTEHIGYAGVDRVPRDRGCGCAG